MREGDVSEVEERLCRIICELPRIFVLNRQLLDAEDRQPALMACIPASLANQLIKDIAKQYGVGLPEGHAEHKFTLFGHSFAGFR